MRRLLTGLGVAAGALVVLRRRRFLRRRRAQAAAVDHAEELKQKLAEQRAEPAPPADADPDPEAPGSSLDERRRAVHDKARAAIDDMLGGERLPGEETE